MILHLSWVKMNQHEQSADIADSTCSHVIAISVAYPDGVANLQTAAVCATGAADELTVVDMGLLSLRIFCSVQLVSSHRIKCRERFRSSRELGWIQTNCFSGEILGAPQEYEEGYTHTNASELSWNVTGFTRRRFKSTRFRLHANAVNGIMNKLEIMNSFEIRIPGVNYQGEVSENTESLSNGNRQLFTGIIGISALLIVGFWATETN